jgi:hypothetical protein
VPPIATETATPVFVTIPSWCQLVGMSRSATYQALARGDLRAKKIGARTLINFASGLAWINGLPDATIRPAKAA